VPAYRRIALPMLGLATLALPAAATGATSGVLVSGSSLSSTAKPVSAPAASSAVPAVRARVLRPGD